MWEKIQFRFKLTEITVGMLIILMEKVKVKKISKYIYCSLKAK